MLRRLAPYLVAIGVPWLLLMASSRGAWLFDSGGADNWAYLKFFREWHLQDPATRRIMEGDYKAARLAWVVPGWAAWRLLGPYAGTVVLHTAYLVLAAAALAVIASALFGRRVAAIMAAAVMALPFVHGSSLGSLWNYHGNAALAYWLWGMAALTVVARSGRPGRPGWAWLAGAAFYACVTTDVIYCAFLPVVLLHGTALWVRWRRVPVAAAWAAAGAASVFVVLALASVSVGGHAWYPRQLIAATLDTANPAGLERTAVGAWLPRALHLTMPLVALAAGIVALPWIVGRRRRVVGLVVAELAVAFGTLAVLEAGGYATLQTPFWAATLTGPTLVALAGLVHLAVGDLAGVPPTWLAAAASLGFAVPQALLDERTIVRARGLADALVAVGGQPVAWAVPIALGLVGLGSLWSARRAAGSVVLGLAVLGVAAATAGLRPGAVSVWERCEGRQDELAAVLAVADAVPEDARGTSTIWYDGREQLAVAGCPPRGLRSVGIAAAQATAMANVSELAATPADVPNRYLDPRARVGRIWVVLGRAPTIDASVASLRSRRAMQLVDARSVETETIRFEIRVLRAAS